MNSTQEKIIHKVFPRTYLRTVVFAMSYGKLSKECYSDLAQFIHSTFGFEVSEELLENLSSRPLCFGAEDQSVVWSITDVSLEIYISQEAYVSFETTLKPMIERISSFLIAMNRDVLRICLNKVNLIPVTLSSYEDLKENAAQVFTDSVVAKWDGDIYQRNENALIYLMKEKGKSGMDIDSYCGFISKGGVAEDQPARYIMDITARYSEPISPDCLLDCVELINDQLYQIFMDSVSEEIIRSMEEV